MKEMFREKSCLNEYFLIYLIVFKPLLEMNVQGTYSVSGHSRCITINGTYQLTHLEAKSMMVLQFAPLKYSEQRKIWEDTRPTLHHSIQRNYGSFYDFNKFGLPFSVLKDIRKFETAQLVDGAGVQAVIDMVLNMDIGALKGEA